MRSKFYVNMILYDFNGDLIFSKIRSYLHSKDSRYKLLVLFNVSRSKSSRIWKFLSFKMLESRIIMDPITTCSSWYTRGALLQDLNWPSNLLWDAVREWPDLFILVARTNFWKSLNKTCFPYATMVEREDARAVAMVLKKTTEYAQFGNSLLWDQVFNGSQHHRGPWKQSVSIQDGPEYPSQLTGSS